MLQKKVLQIERSKERGVLRIGLGLIVERHAHLLITLIGYFNKLTEDFLTVV